MNNISCWWCGEDIFPDRDNDIEVLEGEKQDYQFCGDEKCIEAIAAEEGWDKEYNEILEKEEVREDFTLKEYVLNKYYRNVHLMTKEDYEELKVEETEFRTNKGKKSYKKLHDSGNVVLAEKCDCGPRILHNNGGNYHARLKIMRDENDRYWYKSYTTCELTSYKWKKLDARKVEEKIGSFIKDIGHPNLFIK